MKLLKVTRHSTDKQCNCYICLTGRSVSHPKVVKGRGLSKTTTSITIENGLLAAGKTESHQPQTKQEEAPNTFKICIHCKNTVARGISHPCKPSNTVDNVLDIVDTLPKQHQDQVLYSKLKDCIGSRSGEAIIATKGSKAKVALNPPEQKKAHFTEQNLDNFQEKTGCSSNFMEGVTNLIRTGAGKGAVPSYYRDHASIKAKLLEDTYHISFAVMDVGEGKRDNRPII